MKALRRSVLTAAALAVASSWSVASAKDKIVIRSIPIGNLKIVDPIWTTAYITRNHAYLVWDTLFALDDDNKPQPQMVDTWKVSDDKLLYTFTLRDGLMWHDNTPVKAADCVASIKRWAAKDGMGQVMMQSVDSIDTVDDKTFTIKLKQPIGFVIDALAKIDSNVPFMMPERIAKTDPNTQITEVIGSGPFRFVKEEWNPGSKVVYEKFEGYVPRKEPASQAAGGKVVKVDRIESIYMPDPSVAISALKAGEIDLMENPPADLLKLLETDPNIALTQTDPLGAQLFVIINHLYPPFDKLEARQALQAAISQKEWMTATSGDPKYWRECTAIYGCGSPNESHAGDALLKAQNLDKAKALLKASGYDGGPVVVLDPTDLAQLHASALMLSQTLRRLGMKVDLQAMDWGTMTQRRASKAKPGEGGWNLFSTNATVTNIANPLTHNYAKNCDQAWYGWPCDQRIVDATNKWAMETDPTKRKALIDELQKLNMETVSYIPVGQYTGMIAHRKNLTGMLKGPALFYWNIEKK